MFEVLTLLPLASMKNVTTTHKNLGEIVFFSCSLSLSASFYQVLTSGFSSLAQDEALPRRRWADPRPELDQSWPRAPVYDRALSARVRRGHADQVPLLPKWPQHYKAGLPPLTFGFKSANIFKVGDLVSSDYYTGWLWKDDHVSKKDEQGLITARLAKTWPKAFYSCAHSHFFFIVDYLLPTLHSFEYYLTGVKLTTFFLLDVSKEIRYQKPNSGRRSMLTGPKTIWQNFTS